MDSLGGYSTRMDCGMISEPASWGTDFPSMFHMSDEEIICLTTRFPTNVNLI